MHLEILTKNQTELLPLLKDFSSEFGLVGGTAIALQLGHRESIDFDLFKKGDFNVLKLKKNINKHFPIGQVLVENGDEYTLGVHDVQLTFYNYPFDISYEVKVLDIISVPSLLTLAAMKAFALGKRAKWKDYVDLYFIFQRHTLADVVRQSEEIFKGEFSEKLFREQLCYHDDLDYTETVTYRSGYEIEASVIKKSLLKISLS